MIKVFPWLKALGLLGVLLPTIGQAYVDIAGERIPFEVKKGTRFELCNDVAAYINNHRDHYDTNPRELFTFKAGKFNKPKSTPSTKERYIQLALQSVAHSKIRLTGFNSWKKNLERVEQRMQEQLEAQELVLDTNDPVPTTEAQQAVDSFINHLADIQKYENSYGHMVDEANNNLASSSAFSGLDVATVGELFKPIAGYILERFSPADGSIDLTQFAHSINGQVMLGITDGNGDIASSVKGSAGDGNDLLVAVENKSNSFSGNCAQQRLKGNTEHKAPIFIAA
ncbi:hypothetical protein [Thalassomonas sp. RHCl1]|uniref:hypothetical protein n=1 Tax=Thalassomonas sp. RHCl1 TaxID=2995320 RepID=UPI00248B2E0D|nr:hypothetical protein [Thalassomonas sp. RHCl1]